MNVPNRPTKFLFFRRPVTRAAAIVPTTTLDLISSKINEDRIMSGKLQIYETQDITVTFDPGLCIHSGKCVLGLPAVFDVRRKRWVRPEAASADAVAAQVEKCPSGALQYSRPDRS